MPSSANRTTCCSGSSEKTSGLRYRRRPMWEIRADQGQLHQVLMNLVVNACEAMPTGGTLSITTRNTSEASGRDYLLLEVRDTEPRAMSFWWRTRRRCGPSPDDPAETGLPRGRADSGEN